MMDHEDNKDVIKNFDVGIHEGTLIVFVTGEATHSESPAVKTLIVQSINEKMKGIQKVAVHLHHCAYMDSTFMGTLMVIDKASMKNLGQHIEIISPSQFCENLLEQMGLHNYLPIRREWPEYTGDRWPISALELSRLEKARHLLEAHQQLSAISEENFKQFQLIEKLLQQDIKNLKEEEVKSS